MTGQHVPKATASAFVQAVRVSQKVHRASNLAASACQLAIGRPAMVRLHLELLPQHGLLVVLPYQDSQGFCCHKRPLEAEGIQDKIAIFERKDDQALGLQQLP